MTPRKEIYIKIKDTLKTIPELELIALFNNKFDAEGIYSGEWTAAVIKIDSIKWEPMVEWRKKGECTIDVLLYCKDGWMDQHHKTTDPNDGLSEIDLLDTLVEKLEFLTGENFKPLNLSEEETEEVEIPGIIKYRQSYTTQLYRVINNPYTYQTLTIKPDIDVSN